MSIGRNWKATDEDLLRLELQGKLASIYREAGGAGHNGARLHGMRAMVAASDPVELVRAWLRKDGGTKRWRDTPEHGVEYWVVGQPWSPLFTSEDKEIALERIMESEVE